MVGSLRSSDPVRIGSYSLTGRIGAGGFGTVYSATGPDGGSVALKVLRPELADDQRLRDRLAREGEAIRRVEGSRTVKVFDVVTEGDYAFLVMELLEGEDLETLVERDGPLTGPQLWFVAEGLTQAMRDIHRAGITHRDLKPSNVIYGPEGVKVVDFGVSVVADQTSLTQTGAFVGTAAWISPEQVRDGDATGQSDVFNLGLVIAFVATGKHPFGSGRADAVMYRISNGAPDLDGLREPLASLVAACLQRDPAQRPTIDQLSEFFRTDGASNLTATGPTGTVIVNAPQAATPAKNTASQGSDLSEAVSTSASEVDRSGLDGIVRTRLVRSRQQPNTTAAATSRDREPSRTSPAVRTVALTPTVIITLMSTAAIALITGVLLLSGSEQTATDSTVLSTIASTTSTVPPTTTTPPTTTQAPVAVAAAIDPSTTTPTTTTTTTSTTTTTTTTIAPTTVPATAPPPVATTPPTTTTTLPPTTTTIDTRTGVVTSLEIVDSPGGHFNCGEGCVWFTFDVTFETDMPVLDAWVQFDDTYYNMGPRGGGYGASSTDERYPIRDFTGQNHSWRLRRAVNWGSGPRSGMGQESSVWCWYDLSGSKKMITVTWRTERASGTFDTWTPTSPDRELCGL